MPELGEFEGRDVIQVKIIVTKTGDGLSESMAIEPRILHVGDETYFVAKVTTKKIRHEVIKDTDCLARIQILEASTATLLDDDVIKRAIADQETKNEAAREEARIAKAGSHEASLALEASDEVKNLIGEHVLGLHADGLVDDCPRCDDEIEADADEAATKATDDADAPLLDAVERAVGAWEQDEAAKDAESVS